MSVVLETGGPVLTPWRNKVRALLDAWYPGQEGGPAIARVLFGDTDPGGRLPTTFPRKEGDTPANTAGQYDIKPDHIIGGDAIFEAVRAARVLRHIAANG